MKQAVSFLKQNGYVVIPKFLSAQKCDEARQQINRIIDQFQPNPSQITIFDVDKNDHRLSKYFLESSDKVRFFFEKNVWKDGKLLYPKREAINKIGHNLHEHNKIFENITYAEGVEQICAAAQIKKPEVVQSMAILKPPKIGGKVTIHQDATYLYDEPETLLGFWIPLEDATKQNGCLWGIPGSHQGKLYFRSKVVDGVPSQERFHQNDFKQSDCVPLEMQRGSLAVFYGRFLHKSYENKSQKSRYAYTWHLKDKHSKWLADNWLQRPYFPKFPLRSQK